jgi:hypothetical protein
MKRLGLGIIVAIGFTLPAFGQNVGPLIGTWKFNPEKSTYVGIPPMKSSMQKPRADLQVCALPGVPNMRHNGSCLRTQWLH